MNALGLAAMADLVMELADEGQLAMLMDGHPDADALQALLFPMLPGVDWLAIGGAVREAESPQLGVHLAIMVSRLTADRSSPDMLSEADLALATAMAIVVQSGHDAHRGGLPELHAAYTRLACTPGLLYPERRGGLTACLSQVVRPPTTQTKGLALIASPFSLSPSGYRAQLPV